MAHPKRKEWAEELAKTLNCSIVWDERNDIWDTARRAWLELSNDECEFGVVIQDDAILCDNFIEEVHKLVIKTYHYRTIYQLYINGDIRIFTKEAIEFGRERNYIFSRELAGGVATVIPRSMIKDIIHYGNQSFYPGDDTKIKMFCLRYGIPVTYPFPSLVDHRRRKDNPSLSGNEKDMYSPYFYGHTTEE